MSVKYPDAKRRHRQLVGSNKQPSYTKKGPGRYHKQGSKTATRPVRSFLL